MGRHSAHWLLVLGSGALIGVPAAASPCRLCAPSSGLEQPGAAAPVTIEVQTSLDFDRLVLTGPGGGTVRLSPDGASTAKGAVTGPGGRAMVGSVIVRGEPHHAVRVELPHTIELWGYGGGRIVIERIEADLPPAPRLDSTGRLSFRFGGEVRIEGDAHGDYRGEVPVTVEYP